MFAGNRMLAYLGPAMRWAAQEDLIPNNFVPDIRKAPENKRTRKLTDAEIRPLSGAPATISARARRRRISAAWCASSGHSATSRRCRLASPRPYPRRHVAAGRQQVEPPAQPRAAAAGAGTGRAGRRTGLRIRRQLGKISGFSKLKIALDEASGVKDWRLHDLRRTAATRCKDSASPTTRAGGPESRGARCRRPLPAGRTRKAEGRGAGDMGHGPETRIRGEAW